MKIMIFNKENKWVEVERGLNFGIFYSKVILAERPFKFVDCTDDEKEDFLLYLVNESAGLDDCEYGRFDVSDNNSVDNIFIFDDYQLYTLDRAISRHELILNQYKKMRKEIKENDEDRGFLVFKYDTGIYNEDGSKIEGWRITVRGNSIAEAKENLLKKIEEKWNENHVGTPLPTENISYCRL